MRTITLCLAKGAELNSMLTVVAHEFLGIRKLNKCHLKLKIFVPSGAFTMVTQLSQQFTNAVNLVEQDLNPVAFTIGAIRQI